MFWSNDPGHLLHHSDRGSQYASREYIAYYNSRRLHTTIGGMTPMDFGAGLKAKCP